MRYVHRRFPAGNLDRREIALSVSEPILQGLYTLVFRTRSLFRLSCYPLHRDEAIAPIIIIGAPRSGNTLLRRILTAHPAVHIPPETLVLEKCIRLYRLLSHLEWDILVDLIMSRIEYQKYFYTMDLDSLQPLRDWLVELSPDRRSLSAILDGFYRYHAAKYHKNSATWGEKSPWNIVALHGIDKTFPRARYIHIVRHGIDEIASYMEMQSTQKPLAYFVLDWQRRVKRIMSFIKSRNNRAVQVKYEDLVCNPKVETKRLCHFLGLAFKEEMIETTDVSGLGDARLLRHHANVGKPISPASIGKGLERFDARELEFILTRIRPLLKRLGYADKPARRSNH